MLENPSKKTKSETRLLHWTKDAFSLNYSIFENGQMVGVINDRSTNRSIKASLFDDNFVFEGEGFLKPRMNIIDLQQKIEIGQIRYNFFRSGAKIELSGIQYTWKFDNFLYTKWSLSNSYGNAVILGEKRKEGVFHIHPEIHPALYLSSLIIRNRYTKHGY
ncbi:MAG: hypothetical protein CL670_09875 [Balneola sp.]|jgi:hypothetical protein|nr:hypothetical protein [Balneola sp.]MBE79451.1 hypothetical protein [Balneola sp.]HBX66052.1 hypothetical protein [Balneolaceae bacterium]|tara:strand:- start:233 stop:715 length:483 start_codon:yes stop_codon:yes gene_type:complete